MNFLKLSRASYILQGEVSTSEKFNVNGDRKLSHYRVLYTTMKFFFFFFFSLMGFLSLRKFSSYYFLIKVNSTRDGLLIQFLFLTFFFSTLSKAAELYFIFLRENKIFSLYNFMKKKKTKKRVI